MPALLALVIFFTRQSLGSSLSSGRWRFSVFRQLSYLWTDLAMSNVEDDMAWMDLDTKHEPPEPPFLRCESELTAADKEAINAGVEGLESHIANLSKARLEVFYHDLDRCEVVERRIKAMKDRLVSCCLIRDSPCAAVHSVTRRHDFFAYETALW